MVERVLVPGRALTRAEVREVDRRAIEELGIPGVVLMENAGLGLCRVVLEERARLGLGGGVLVVAGRGNNGGDGFVLARQLAARGVSVRVAYCPGGEGEPAGDAGVNFRALRQGGAEAERVAEGGALKLWLTERAKEGFGVVVDALYGTGLESPLRPEGLALVEALAECGLPVIACDVPSGICCDTGRVLGAAVRALRTVSFVGRKVGFDAPGAADYTGVVEVVGIGCPPLAWSHVR